MIKMKKYIFYKSIAKALTILLIPAFIISCNTDLTEELKGSLSESTLASEDDAFALIDGCYQLLISSGYGYFSSTHAFMFDGSTDAFIPEKTSKFETYRWNEDIGLELWTISYQMVSRANTAIALIENMDDAEFNNVAVKARLIGEAKFLRAYSFYLLTSAFGDVPLILDASDATPARTPFSKVVTQIKLDLDAAIASLDVTYEVEVGRATKGAAYTLLAKVLLRDKNYLGTQEAIAEIMKLDVYDLFTEGSYGELWLESNRKDNEFIFSIMSHGEDYNTASNHHIKLFSPWGYDLGWANVGVPKEVYYAMTDDDERKAVIVDDLSGAYYGYIQKEESAISWLGFAIFQKYSGNNRDVTAPGNIWGNYACSKLNVPLLRYADVLLLKAEVENELNGGPSEAAYNAINEVRVRAGVDELAANLSKSEFEEALLLERAIELAGEGHRRDDLIRFGVFEEKVNAHIAAQAYPAPVTVVEAHKLFPIPRTEIELNPNMKPNPSNDLANY